MVAQSDGEAHSGCGSLPGDWWLSEGSTAGDSQSRRVSASDFSTFFFLFFQPNWVVMIITAIGFFISKLGKTHSSWHGEIKTINVPCLEVPCPSGAVLQGEGQHRSLWGKGLGKQSWAALRVNVVLAGKLKRLGSSSAEWCVQEMLYFQLQQPLSEHRTRASH